ncbi:MAG: hypothetical protein EXS35_14105 [Pedosphaera sp.]|nr:hypothetical protein [Pedosphaera sp.]
MREKLPFFALVIASCVITILAQDKWHALAKGNEWPLSYRMANALTSYLRYAGKLFWPSDLAAFYPFPPTAPWDLAVVAGAVVLVLSAGIVWWRKSQPFLFTGWFWFFGTLVPVIGLVQVGGQSLADRYLYIPSIGFFVAAVWLSAGWITRLQRCGWMASVLALGILGACVGLSARQIATWKNSRTLFEQANRVTTGNFVALNTLGELARRDGQPEQARSSISVRR